MENNVKNKQVTPKGLMLRTILFGVLVLIPLLILGAVCAKITKGETFTDDYWFVELDETYKLVYQDADRAQIIDMTMDNEVVVSGITALQRNGETIFGKCNKGYFLLNLPTNTTYFNLNEGDHKELDNEDIMSFVSPRRFYKTETFYINVIFVILAILLAVFAEVVYYRSKMPTTED